MKSTQPVFAIALLTLGIICSASGRFVHGRTYQELTDKADLVVIARPMSNDDTAERAANWHGFAGESVIGVDTKFTSDVVLKGDKSVKTLTLHHYRENGFPGTVANGPLFISFGSDATTTYILFLTREADGRYAPVNGQVDPGIAIKRVGCNMAPGPTAQRPLDFLKNIPAFCDLSLEMSENFLQSQIIKYQLYVKKTVIGDANKSASGETESFWVVTPEGENVSIGFRAGKCTGIQRLQPIPKQQLEAALGAPEYRAWMERRAGNRMVLPF